MVGQVIGVVVGSFFMIALMLIPYGKLRSVSGAGIFAAIVLLIGVWIPHFGVRLDDANRWVKFLHIQLQSSEFAKLALVIVTASVLTDSNETRRPNLLGLWTNILKLVTRSGLQRRVNPLRYKVTLILLLTAICMLLIEKEPDLGTAAVLLPVVLAQLFLGGTRKFTIFIIILSAVTVVGVVGFLGPNVKHRIARIEAFFNPSLDPQGIDYQMRHSLLAVGSGGWTGVGLGKGKEKYYLPQANSDFIFATYAEETGFLGCIILLLAFSLFAWRAYVISLNAPDQFGRILASGLGSLICVQAALNVAVVEGIVPNTGVPLPFISHGSSSLILSLCSVGILLNIGSSKAPPEPLTIK
jgi:cell division protein FtsW